MPMMQRRRVDSPRRKRLITDSYRVQQIMLDALKAHAEEVKASFEGVVSDWSAANRPEFEVKINIWANELRVIVKPKRTRSRKGGKAQPANIFEYVDKGTKPHVIRPKASNKSKLLAFVWGGPGSYSAKTLPVAQAHMGSGEVVNGSLTFARGVNHPGTDARLFSETIQRETYPDFRKTIEAAFRRMERESKK